MTDLKKEKKKFTFWHGLFLAEFIAILVGLATTIVPSKTSSDSGVAGYFFEEPTFMQEFLVNFLFFNIILILLAAGLTFWWWKTRSSRSATEK